MGASSAKVTWPTDPIQPDRTFIVTGGNSGIGFEMAKHLALMGARVIIACRSELRAKAAMLRMEADMLDLQADSSNPFNYNKVEKLQVEYMQLDLSSLQSVMGFVEAFKAKGYPLHVLLCNAGVAFAPQGYTTDGFETHFQVNYLAHFLLILHLLPIMRQSGPDCRIISTTSASHSGGVFNLKNIQLKSGYGRNKAYGNSKLFQIMQTHALGRRLEGSTITVSTFHPGAIDTNISKNFEDSGFFNRAWRMGKATGMIKQDVMMGAATGINCAVNPQLRGMATTYYVDCLPTTSSVASRDLKYQEVLWRYSLECVQQYVSTELLEGLTVDLKELLDPPKDKE